MSIGRLIKKATSILLIVAMVMTSAGIHTLANSIDAVVEMAKVEKDVVEANDAVVEADSVVTGDTVGASTASPEEDETTVVAGDSVEASDTVGASTASPEEENKEDSQDEVEENSDKKENSEEPEEDETTTEKEETTEEVVESEETTVAAEEETTEEVVETEETTVAEEENIASASEADEETDFDFENVVISTSSEALLGTDTITLTYNFNDKSNGGKGSTDAIIADEDKEKVPETKVVENGKKYGEFEKDIYFIRKGYTLLGWSFERDGEVIKETDIVDLTEDKTIYAIWEPKKYQFSISKNIYVNDEMSNGKSSIEFTFDENIIKTINDNGIKPPTKDTDPEIYDCLEFIGWGFNGDYNVVKDTDDFTDTSLIHYAPGAYLFAIYDIKYIHVKLNANDLGYYDTEDNKILDLGLVPANPRKVLTEIEGYREPTPFKDMRFEKWWVPLIPEAPYDPHLESRPINIAMGGWIGSDKISKEVAEFRWNEEYKAHYEEDRYRLRINAGGMFHVTLSAFGATSPAYDGGVFTDDSEKFVFTDRLGNRKGGGSRESRTIYALKGKTVKEALEEAGFEAPVAFDRDFLGWQQGEHPDRVDGRYINFNPVDFSKIVIEGPMEFTAVWKKKPLKLTFKKGPNMTFASGREEFTLLLPARDKYAGGNGVNADAYEGNLYDLKNIVHGEQGYEDPVILDDDGKEDNYNFEFRRWEDDGEFQNEKIIFWTHTYKSDRVWIEEQQQYAGLQNINVLDYDFDRKSIYENGECFQVDKKGRKYINYGGDPYREEPYEFTPVVDRVQLYVGMFSPFPVFPLQKHKMEVKVGSGTRIGEVDEYINTNFSEVEEQGYHFAGWYQIDDDKIKKTLLNFPGPSAASIDTIEDYFNGGTTTVAGMSKPGLDTWFKYVQCTATNDIGLAHGQYLKKIDGDFLINRENCTNWGMTTSKIDVDAIAGIDIVPIFTANLTLDAGDGKFADGSKEKIIDKIVIDTITPIRDYVRDGYEVPTPDDDSKVFSGWRLVDEEGNDVRLFGDFEVISKDTKLVASYIDKQNSVTLTIELHGAETIEDTGTVDEDGNNIYNVVEVPPAVMIVPQGIAIGEVYDDFPVVKRKGYKYNPVHTNKDAWFYNYDSKTGEYSKEVREEDHLYVDTTIHLRWTKDRFSYDFIYEIDGEKEGYASITGEYGQALKDCQYYKELPQIRRMFDFSVENQPVKGYMITGINLYEGAGNEVTPESLIEGNIRSKISVKPMDTTITFDANGGELVGENTITVPYATYYKDIKDIVPKASNSELAFVGWIDDKGDQVTDEYRIATTYEKENVKQAKFTAEWTDRKYVVTFDAGEGKFSDGSNKLSFEKVPYMQILSSIKEGDKVYEEPTLANKVFDKWEVILKHQFNREYTKDSKFGEAIRDIDEEVKSEIVLKALYVDKTVTFAVKLHDPNQFFSGMTFVYLPKLKEKIIPHDYVFDLGDVIGFKSHFHSGGTYIQTVKEGMTFGQWFDYLYDNGYRYRTEDGYLLCGWKYEEPASIEAPRKKTFDMKDVDMDAPIKDGDVFTPLMAKGSFKVQIDANGGYYKDLIHDKETSTGVKIHQEYIDLVTYENVPAGTRSDKIDGMYIPVRPGYTLTGYSRYKDVSKKSLASSVFVAGDEYLYAVWSENGNQYVRPTVHTRDTSNSGGGGSGTGGVGPIQNANAPRVGAVEGIGPQDSLPADAPKQYTQNVSVEENQQTQAQVTQLIANAGISADAANTSQVQQAVAEVAAGMNIVEQYAKITAQINANPSITAETTPISGMPIEAREAYWHTDANGNVSLESNRAWGFVKDVWQPVTNSVGQTGWYKFDANGHMQTGLVQDGNYTYYLSEERGAGYGQMVCNQTINIGGLSMTFNANGALVDMSYSVEAAVQTLQNAVVQAQVGPQPAIAGPQPAQANQVGPQPAQANQVGPATFLSTQPVGPGV